MLKKVVAMLCLAVGIGSFAIAGDNDITVYYFHANMRCYTCNKMEEYTKDVVAVRFKDNKNVVFKAVNTDEPANKHFITDYSLYTKSVVLADRQGNWKNLDKIWTLVRNENNFKEYIANEINDFMKGKK